MRVWLLHIGEQLPVDGPTRPFRYSYLARALQDAEHDVLRWAPTFSHFDRKQRFATDRRVATDGRYSMQFVHAPGYRKNVGLARLRTYRILKRRFCQLAAQETPPDIIVAAIPSLEWAEAAVAYGRAHGVPVVVDIRDLWPDVFLNAMPTTARPLGRVALRPYYRIARRACQQADALAAVSQGYLNWALQLAGRVQGLQDKVVPLGFEPDSVPAEVRQANLAKLRDRGIDPARPICMFAGSFEHSYDLETVVDAARRLEAMGQGDVQFVLCGDGSKMPAIKRRAEQIRSVHLLGWVDPLTLQAVSSISAVGLCAYAKGALQSLPNKPFEYMAGRLAIVSSLPGELAGLIGRERCGLTYEAGNPTSLAVSLHGLLTHPAQLESMRANAYETWSRCFRSRDIYANFARHLTSITKTAARAA